MKDEFLCDRLGMVGSEVASPTSIIPSVIGGVCKTVHVSEEKIFAVIRASRICDSIHSTALDNYWVLMTQTLS